MKLAATIAAALIAAATFAANLGAYRYWATSPQGYFMTKAERAAWAKVGNEAEAADFVKKFVASRGPGFEAEVAERAKAADERLTVAGRPGSKTLCGKVVIVLGPPLTFSKKRFSQGSAAIDSNLSHARTGRSEIMHPPNTPPVEVELRAKYCDDYTFTYANNRVIVVSVNPKNGDDRILDPRMAREVRELLEEAAKARASIIVP